MSKSILITNGRSPAGLDLTRTFEKNGHKVFVAESFPVHLCQFSRFGHGIRVPSPSQNPHEYVDRIQQIVDAKSIDLIVPVYEEIFPLSFFKKEIGCPVFCDEFNLLRKIHNKFTFIGFCKELGLSAPDTRLIHSVEELGREEYVLKPEYSRFGTDVFIKPTEQVLKQIDFSVPWVCQEYLDGDQYCVYAVAHQGKLLLHSIYPVEATMLGVSISYRHEPVDPITKWVEAFVAGANFSGSISFDFVFQDQVVYPIECNPRVTSGVHLFSEQSPLVDAILDHKPYPNPTYPPAMAGPFVFMKALVNWKLWGTYFRSKDVIFKWLDPFTLVGQGCVIAYLRYLARRKGLTTSQASSLDLEYNGEDFEKL